MWENLKLSYNLVTPEREDGKRLNFFNTLKLSKLLLIISVLSLIIGITMCFTYLYNTSSNRVEVSYKERQEGLYFFNIKNNSKYIIIYIKADLILTDGVNNIKTPSNISIFLNPGDETTIYSYPREKIDYSKFSNINLNLNRVDFTEPTIHFLCRTFFVVLGSLWPLLIFRIAEGRMCVMVKLWTMLEDKNWKKALIIAILFIPYIIGTLILGSRANGRSLAVDANHHICGWYDPNKGCIVDNAGKAILPTTIK